MPAALVFGSSFGIPIFHRSRHQALVFGLLDGTQIQKANSWGSAPQQSPFQTAMSPMFHPKGLPIEDWAGSIGDTMLASEPLKQNIDGLRDCP